MPQAVCMKQRIIQFIVDNSCTVLERIRSQQGTVFFDTQETEESVIVEKATLEVVKSPGALAGDPGHKNNISSSL